jgi:hypothetical protein
MNYKLPFENDETIVGAIKRIFHNLQQSLVEKNVRSAFVHLGLSDQVNVRPDILVFD